MDENPQPVQFSLLRVLAAMTIFAMAGAVAGIGQPALVLVPCFIGGGVAVLLGVEHGAVITAAWIALIPGASFLISCLG